MKLARSCQEAALVWHAGVCAASIAVSLFAHRSLARMLAGRDVLEALLNRFEVGLGAALVALISARLFLFVLAPGWSLYVIVRLILSRAIVRAK